MQKIRGHILDPYEGLWVADLTGNVVTVEEFRKCVSKFLAGLGVSTPNQDHKQVFNALYASIKEDGWSVEHMEQATAKMMRGHKYIRTSVADWYGVDLPKIYPESWYKRQLASGASAGDFECYEIDGVVVFKERDDVDLPYPKVNYKEVQARRAEVLLKQMSNDYERSDTPAPVGTVIQKIPREQNSNNR